ncbi:MAG: HPr family phosphocarrier protein [Oscillospiraceae bacterium]|nr:HPr family phosphocarrier protein [Oscillospiraceae bacterium]
MTYKVRIKTPEEAQRLNKIAEQCPYDIWIHGKSGTADAKSLLGMMLLTLEPEVKLVVDDHIDVKPLEKAIADFIVE